MRVKITTFVPLENADQLRQALGKAGAGDIGEYSHCSFSVVGVGRFTPSGQAKPRIGSQNVPEEVAEERVEVVCERSMAKAVVDALKTTHPYEEVAFDIVPLIDEEDL